MPWGASGATPCGKAGTCEEHQSRDRFIPGSIGINCDLEYRGYGWFPSIIT
jgi:hypothetical protein